MAQRGRPREFDMEDALDRAIDVFWRQGYSGTSLSDLTRAMGISRPSLYGAFGTKEETFKLAVERYARIDMAYVTTALAAPTAYETAGRYLRDNVDAVTTPGKPAGCLSIQGGLSASPDDDRVVRYLAERRADGEARFAARFAQAITDGDLPASENPAALAKYVSTVSAGLAVQAAAGVARDDLHRVVDRALLAFPRRPEAEALPHTSVTS
ncbi:transcriptional regulator, TetR family [Actinacidiphila yanglinensis]|uniref:Transcriptional regulator, TetR family n=1 Tax=Actinacidiphila yanglinensis TaxID=310779 RepID=A0A1H6E4W3_9ACTN|nr:TetR/AcrR family transcriptional regulator [Actinacidiphila yanglinensis]SEG92263.1 transcriptional regulator, TetR family [Actinacidiphila yanglinensis]